MKNKYQLISQNSEKVVFETNDVRIIKKNIIDYLQKNKSDTLEYWIDNEINSFYSIPSPLNKVCKLIFKGNKEYYKCIEP
jgi:hypothetical protein